MYRTHQQGNGAFIIDQKISEGAPRLIPVEDGVLLQTSNYFTYVVWESKETSDLIISQRASVLTSGSHPDDNETFWRVDKGDRLLYRGVVYVVKGAPNGNLKADPAYTLEAAR